MKVGIVGASGYVGGEVVRLLLSHPEAEVSMVTSTKHVGEYLHKIHPSLTKFTKLILETEHTHRHKPNNVL